MIKQYKPKPSARAEIRKVIEEREQGLRVVSRPLKSPQRARTRVQKPAFMRNPATKPALGNGRVQKACKRALYGLIEATTPEIVTWTVTDRHHTWRALRQ